MSEKIPTDLGISASLSFNKAEQDFLGLSRIELLEKIDQCGSITKASKAQGICYRTAWLQIDTLNNLAEKPLVECSAGGRNGGGTCLTDEGKEVIRRYRAIEAEQERFLAALGEHLDEGEKFYQFLRKINMKTSARNLWTGEVVKLSQGTINTLVEIKLKGGDILSAQVTCESIETLELAEGREVFAMVKAPAVIVVKELGEASLSSCNILKGRVCRVIEGKVNSEVTLELAGGSTVSATITKNKDSILLAEGDEAWAVFQESSVILGVI